MAEFDVEFIADDADPEFIALADGEGHEDEFVIIGCVRVEALHYVLAVPVSAETVETADEDLVYVFAVRRDGDDEYFEYVADEDRIADVFDRYEELYRDAVGEE